MLDVAVAYSRVQFLGEELLNRVWDVVVKDQNMIKKFFRVSINDPPFPIRLCLHSPYGYIGPPTCHMISQVISRSSSPLDPRMAIATDRPIPEAPAS